MKKAFQQEIILAPAEKKRSWIALSLLLNGVPEWSCKLSTLGNFDAPSDPLEARNLLLTKIHHIILTKVQIALTAIQNKQKEGIKKFNLSKILKAQNRALILFNGRLTALISEMGRKECTLPHLQTYAGQALRFFRELQGIQMLQRRIIETDALEDDKQVLKSKSETHLRTFEKNEKLLKRQFAQDPPLLQALLTAHAQLKAHFFALGLDKLKKTLNALVVSIGEDFKETLDLNPDVPKLTL